MPSENDCPLCNEPLAGENDTTPCDHVFHSECIHGWVVAVARINDYVSCPVCEQSLNYVKPGLDRMGVDGWRAWGPGGPEVEIFSRQDGWRAWSPAEGWAPAPDLYVFNIRAPDGRRAIGCYFLYGLWWNPWQTLNSVLNLLADIPRVNIQVEDPNGERVLVPTKGREEEWAMLFDMDGVVGPFLWQEGGVHTSAVQARVDYAVMFSLVWLDKYE